MSADLPQRRRLKAYGYLTAGRKLLVFREPDFPEAGLQVPGGTVEFGESIEQALVRELGEELGRSDFDVVAFLGAQLYVYERDEVRHVHDRHFFHVAPRGAWPEAWEHADQTPDAGGPPVRMAFSWMDLEDPALRLYAGLDGELPALRLRLGVGS